MKTTSQSQNVASDEVSVHPVELVPVADLRAHARNYRGHPPDQRRHIRHSMEEHGVYRNVVLAQDGTILAGHGVVEAAVEAGVEHVPAVRLPYGPEDPEAIKVLTGDNELGRLAELDDRLLSELLREVRDTDVNGLLGTGYDDEKLANLVYVTRPRDEIAELDDAAAWVGMPDFGTDGQPLRVMVSLSTEEDRAALLEHLGVEVPHYRRSGVWSVWWPPKERDDTASLRFQEGEEE